MQIASSNLPRMQEDKININKEKNKEEQETQETNNASQETTEENNPPNWRQPSDGDGAEKLRETLQEPSRLSFNPKTLSR